MVREGLAALHEFLTIADALMRGTAALTEASESPRLDAELLLARAIDVRRSYLIAHPEDTLDPSAQSRYFDTIEKRRHGMPMAYITGEKEFWSLNLMVSRDTLVPRPDTELLVEQALGQISRRDPVRVLDLGTGSGAIALALARERPLAEVTATDSSEAALAVARLNARQLGIANVVFACGDWTAPVRGQRFDVIVCNPPYVSAGDPALEELSYEPRAALVSGNDGLDDIRRIVTEALGVIEPGGSLMIEHGAGQAADVAGLFESAGWTSARTVRDLAGLERVTTATAAES